MSLSYTRHKVKCLLTNKNKMMIKKQEYTDANSLGQSIDHDSSSSDGIPIVTIIMTNLLIYHL